MTDLKSCPFCGGAAKMKGGPMAQETYSVWCTNLHHMNGSMDKQVLIDAWNTRTDTVERMQWNPDMDAAKKAGWIMLFAPCSKFPTKDMTHWIGKWNPHCGDVGGGINQDDALAEYETEKDGLWGADFSNFNSLTIPQKVGVGVAFGIPDKLTITGDYYRQDWTNAMSGENYNTTNATSMHFGAEYTPDVKSIRGYHKLVSYRVGAYFSNSYLMVNQLTVHRMT